MFRKPKPKRMVPLTILINRWNVIHRDKKVIPAVWGILYLFLLVPLLVALYTTPYSFEGAPNLYGALFLMQLILMLSLILMGILGGIKIQQWYGYKIVLPQMLEYDDLRLMPCLITALQRLDGYTLSAERLICYLNALTADDSALLTAKDYAKLHHYLLSFPTFAIEYEKANTPLRIAILHAIETSGHTASLPAIDKLLSKCSTMAGYDTQLVLAAQQCQQTLFTLQEQAKHNDTLLRPSQREATPDTLLRAASSVPVPNSSHLLHPAAAPANTKKESVRVSQSHAEQQ